MDAKLWAAVMCAAVACLLASPGGAAATSSALEPGSDPVAISGAIATPAAAQESAAPAGWSRLPADHPWMRWSGTWIARTDGVPAGSSRVSRSAGAKSWVTFKGTSVAVVTSVGSDKGHMRVYVDGKRAATVSLFANASASGVVAWSASGLREGKHTVEAVVVGTKDPASTDAWVEVEAFDVDGKFVSPGAYPGTSLQERDERLHRKGSWSPIKRKAAYGDAVVRASKPGTSVTLRFKGTGVTWFGRKDPAGGNAEVWLDGRMIATVSQYSDSVLEPRVVWATSGLKNKVHTITIKNAGESYPGGGTQTELDAFQVQGEVLTAPRPTPFRYPWRTYIVIDKSDFKLYWVKDKMLVKVYPIAHGKAHWSTPERVWRIDKKYHTSPGSVYGPRKMRMFKRVKGSKGYRYIHTNYAIHGTNQEWVIGTRASHGCIRMYNKDVRELFPQVPVGTMVVTRN